MPLDHEGYRPTLFLYDALPGGVGLARRIFERAEDLLSRAARLIGGCACKSGCPACIGAALTAEPQSAIISRADTPRAGADWEEMARAGTTARKVVAMALLEGLSVV
jgi:DEAD/DEAH box helicase domain-containing protein